MRASFMTFVIAVATALHVPVHADQAADTAAAIRAYLGSDKRPYVLRGADERREVWRDVGKIYAAREHRPIWVGYRNRQDELLAVLGEAGSHGLVPDEYEFELLNEKASSRKRWFEDDRDRAWWDLTLTTAMLAYAHDMWDGRVEPDDVGEDHEVYLERPALDPQMLVTRLQEAGAEAALRELEPRHSGYQALRDALAAAPGSFGIEDPPPLELDGLLRRGASGAPVQRLMHALRAAGAYQGAIPDNAAQARFDDDLEAAVKRFQRERALSDDGIVGESTLEQLNLNRTQRLERIAVNLDRWRWLPRELGERHILVNVPAYHLEIVDDGRKVMEMEVIVGTEMNRTPIFSDHMDHVVFSPNWIVPYSIIQNELLPQFRDDPALVNEKNMEVLDREGRVLNPLRTDWDALSAGDIEVRQKPGKDNSLGLVKFMFPNSHAIYLHDTPADELFGESQRAFSHGCIRVREPVQLAQWLLRDQPGWDRAAIEDAMARDEPMEVTLTEPIPVYLVYFTATAGKQDEVRMVADVYGFDEVMMDALARETGHPVVDESLTADGHAGVAE